jgi:hypothetical protein
MTNYAPLLDALPERSRVAVITMTGSCCPVTLAHIQCFAEARSILMGVSPGPKKLESFSQALGFLSLNSDSHVSEKLRKKGLPHISHKNRANLVELATEDLEWMSFNSGREGQAVETLAARWPHLRFIRFALNGADDVLKYAKWVGCGPRKRCIAMGRSGMTERLRKAVRNAGIDLDGGCFIIGPELRDISSTEVRNCLGAGDVSSLEGMLNARVAQWCLTESPYKPRGAALKQGRTPYSESAATGPQQTCLDLLLSMGFDRAQVNEALRAAEGNQEAALEFLLSEASKC